MDIVVTLGEHFQNKIKSGDVLLETLSNSSLQNVSGVDKLKKKIRVEIQFLSKCQNQNKMKEEHLLCTNLHHFEALLNHALLHPCDALLQHFFYFQNETKCKICVDIVADKGHKWIKVISRNPKALSQISLGAGEYGQRSVLHQAEEFILCSRENIVMFQPPEIIFHFSCGIERPLANELYKRGITVSGDILETVIGHSVSDTEDDESSDESSRSSLEFDNQLMCERPLNLKEVLTLNLDVTTLVAYVSNLTNGGSHHTFTYPLLNQQAEWERERPVKPVLDEFFKGRRLFSCKTAISAFQNIVDNLAGPNELRRANELLSQVTEIPDNPSPRSVTKLVPNGKVKPRSIVIFGTGDQIQSVTTTANDGFLRAAKNQGVYFATFLHESRALSEIKEIHTPDDT